MAPEKRFIVWIDIEKAEGGIEDHRSSAQRVPVGPTYPDFASAQAAVRVFIRAQEDANRARLDMVGEQAAEKQDTSYRVMQYFKSKLTDGGDPIFSYLALTGPLPDREACVEWCKNAALASSTTLQIVEFVGEHFAMKMVMTAVEDR